MSDVDVVIVGAGAAGIGAGLELQARGIPFVILEAQDRIGGRAFTDKTSLKRSWDQGCHWLHCADVNPLVAWAERLGASYARQERDDWFGVWMNDGWLDKAGRARAEAGVWDPMIALAEHGRSVPDLPMQDALDMCGPWGKLLRHWVQLMSSGDPESVSARSYADYEDTETNWPVTSGYGDLIERMAAGLPVRSGVPVMAIDQGANTVHVETPAGTITAKGCIVTVSTNVLRSGAVRLSAGPARELLALVEDVPCGAYEKVAIEFGGNPLRDFPTPSASVMVDDGLPVNFQISPYYDGLLLGHMGGSGVRQLLEREGKAALVDLVLDRVATAFGADVRKTVVKAVATDWALNPHVRGAYSYARPGAALRRHQMIAADTGNVAFAGEAFSRNWQATAHGAYQSGRDVAGRIADTLKLAA